MRVYYNPKLKQLARQLRNNSTKSEIKLWQHLKGKQMRGYDFHRQKPIDNFIADFYCNKLKLVIELDGYSHDDDDVYIKDIKKENSLKELGIKTLRFDDKEIMKDINDVLRVIEGFINDYEEVHTPGLPPKRVRLSF